MADYEPIYEYEYLKTFLEYLYLNIIDQVDYTPPKDSETFRIINKMTKRPICLKSKKVMYIVKKLVEEGKKCGVKVIYPTMMCRHHLKKINRNFNLEFSDITELFYYLCDMIILEHDKIRKLISISVLDKIPDLITEFKENPVIVCEICRKHIDEKIKERYYINKEQFGKCERCNIILCNQCMDTHFDDEMKIEDEIKKLEEISKNIKKLDKKIEVKITSIQEIGRDIEKKKEIERQLKEILELEDDKQKAITGKLLQNKKDKDIITKKLKKLMNNPNIQVESITYLDK